MFENIELAFSFDGLEFGLKENNYLVKFCACILVRVELIWVLNLLAALISGFNLLKDLFMMIITSLEMLVTLI